MTGSIPTLDTLKDQAKRLRNSLAQSGEKITHSASLELVAHQHGMKDWNTLFAAAGNRPPPVAFAIGQRVNGEYLGHAFTAKIIAVQAMQSSESFRVTCLFDKKVNVSKFENFPVERYRVTATVDQHGVSYDKTSNGVPHMKLKAA